MKIDLLHNKIIKDTATSCFTDSFHDVLVPKLLARYGDSLLAVQMYEDYLCDGFVEDNVFYYPLTLVFEDEMRREWIKWNISPKKNFDGGIPYSYIGDDYLEFNFADEVPFGFEEKLVGRGMYFEGGCVVFNIQSASSDKTFLAGKYSQTFIDEMARQLTCEIERVYSVSGLAESGVELTLVFAPGTYMEHVVENFTYRRLLITARGCSARDLWIKWTRNNGAVPITVSENVTKDDVTFEIGEDVPHKIREKEYRFLARVSPEKYQAAMGRKHITEWRDMMKRVIKRGELVKNEVAVPDSEKNNELSFRLQEVLTGYTAPQTERAIEPAVESSDIAELLKGVLGAADADFEENETDADVYAAQYADEPAEENQITETFDDVPAIEEEEKEDYIEEPSDSSSDVPFEIDETEETAEESVEEAAEEIAEEIKEEAKEERRAIEDTYERDLLKIREEQLRRQIEAEIREKIALEAKVKAEEEALQLRRAHEELKAENERLAEIARRAEEEKLANEAERAAEAERLRQEIEARERAEAREKERIAEAARLAVLEHQRLEAERAEAERRRKEEEEKIRAERARLEEEARAAESKRIEEERIRAEMAARAEAEARAAREAEERAAAAKAEEDARIEALAKATKPSAEPSEPNYTYTSKNARLLFRRPIDPNITKRIHEIILTTIKYFHKENVYIKIKATVPDSTTVNLHFVKIPEEETELLINIIKVLGKSDLGITKVFLE